MGYRFRLTGNVELLLRADNKGESHLIEEYLNAMDYLKIQKTRLRGSGVLWCVCVGFARLFRMFPWGKSLTR